MKIFKGSRLAYGGCSECGSPKGEIRSNDVWVFELDTITFRICEECLKALNGEVQGILNSLVERALPTWNVWHGGLL